MSDRIQGTVQDKHLMIRSQERGVDQFDLRVFVDVPEKGGAIQLFFWGESAQQRYDAVQVSDEVIATGQLEMCENTDLSVGPVGRIEYVEDISVMAAAVSA